MGRGPVRSHPRALRSGASGANPHDELHRTAGNARHPPGDLRALAAAACAVFRPYAERPPDHAGDDRRGRAQRSLHLGSRSRGGRHPDLGLRLRGNGVFESAANAGLPRGRSVGVARQRGVPQACASELPGRAGGGGQAGLVLAGVLHRHHGNPTLQSPAPGGAGLRRDQRGAPASQLSRRAGARAVLPDNRLAEHVRPRAADLVRRELGGRWHRDAGNLAGLPAVRHQGLPSDSRPSREIQRAASGHGRCRADLRVAGHRSADPDATGEGSGADEIEHRVPQRVVRVQGRGLGAARRQLLRGGGQHASHRGAHGRGQEHLGQSRPALLRDPERQHSSWRARHPGLDPGIPAGPIRSGAPRPVPALGNDLREYWLERRRRGGG